MFKKYNSVATIAFTVHHDDKDELTAQEIKDSLTARIKDVERANEWQEAAGCDFFDTQESEPLPLRRYHVGAVMTTDQYMYVEATSAEEAVDKARDAADSDWCNDDTGDWRIGSAVEIPS